jgi:hypothetical protein
VHFFEFFYCLFDLFIIYYLLFSFRAICQTLGRGVTSSSHVHAVPALCAALCAGQPFARTNFANLHYIAYLLHYQLGQVPTSAAASYLSQQHLGPRAQTAAAAERACLLLLLLLRPETASGQPSVLLLLLQLLSEVLC